MKIGDTRTQYRSHKILKLLGGVMQSIHSLLACFMAHGVYFFSKAIYYIKIYSQCSANNICAFQKQMQIR